MIYLFYENLFEGGRKLSRVSFIAFCIEHYASHVNKPSSDIYKLFKKEKLLDMLDEDYDDLHGMGMEYLMQLFDEYLEGAAL